MLWVFFIVYCWLAIVLFWVLCYVIWWSQYPKHQETTENQDQVQKSLLFFTVEVVHVTVTGDVKGAVSLIYKIILKHQEKGISQFLKEEQIMVFSHPFWKQSELKKKNVFQVTIQSDSVRLWLEIRLNIIWTFYGNLSHNWFNGFWFLKWHQIPVTPLPALIYSQMHSTQTFSLRPP